MFVNTIYRRLLFTIAFLVISLSCFSMIFYPLYTSSRVIINLPSGSFNISEKYSNFWDGLKFLYLIFFVLSNLIFSNIIYPIFFNKNKIKIPESQKFQSEDLHLCIQNSVSNDIPIIIPKEGLYQNILITGTIRNWKN